MKKATAMIVSIAGSQLIHPIQATAADGPGVMLQQMRYQESGGRIDVDYTALTINQDFGTDFSANLSLTTDAITGATPAVDAKTGASQLVTGEDPNLIGDGFVSPDSYDEQLLEMEDTRNAGNASLTWRTPQRHEWTAGISYSEEEDYESQGLSLEYLHHLDQSRNRSLSIGVSTLDNEALFYRQKRWLDANYNTVEIGLTEVLSPNALVKVAMFSMREEGALSNPYKRVIRKVNVADEGQDPFFRYYLSPDKRPDDRRIFGIDIKGVKRIEVLDTPTTLHAQYRVFNDDWGVTSNTIETRAYFGESDARFGQWYGLIRYYNQHEANFYKAPDDVFGETDYATTDERLGELSGFTYSIGTQKQVTANWQAHFRLAYQEQSINLDMDWLWLGLSYEF